MHNWHTSEGLIGLKFNRHKTPERLNDALRGRPFIQNNPNRWQLLDRDRWGLPGPKHSIWQ